MNFKSLQRQLRQTTAQTAILSVAAFTGAQVLGISPTSADEFVIDTPVTVQNGGNVIDGNDTLTVTPDGSITTTGNNNEAVDAAGNNNTIINQGTLATSGDSSDAIDVNNNSTVTNSGSLTTSGTFARGIYSSNNNTITNSGSITTTGNNSFGIRVHDSSSVTNSGSITTSGNDSDGIDLEDRNVVTNTGSVTTTGSNSSGIFADDDDNTINNSGSIVTRGNTSSGIEADDDNVVTNSGTITTTGNDSAGVLLDDRNAVTNAGTISTSGTNSDGIEVDDLSTINNSGSIVTSGVSSAGIFADNNNTITNSGRIVSAQGLAFQIDNDNTVNLNAPSFIGGRFDLGDNTTLNITTGPSHSILWTFDPTQLAGGVPNIAGPVPVFQRAVSATELQVATFDPTTFAASFDALAQSTGILSGLMQQRLSNNNFGTSGNLNSFTAIRNNATKSTSNYSIKQDFGKSGGSYTGSTGPQSWFSLFGSTGNVDARSATLGYDLSTWGLTGGFDMSLSDSWKLGLLAGYMKGDVKSKSLFATSYNNDTSSVFGGIYGRTDFGSAFVNFALTGGVSTTKQKRFVNDNLAPLGVSSARAKYDSAWISPEITFGMTYQIAESWTTTPSLKLRYAKQWFDGYSETGPSASNATVGKRQAAIGEVSAEWALNRKTDISSTTLRLGLLYTAAFGGKSNTVTMVGQTQSLASFSKDRAGGYIGINTTIALTDMLNFDLGGKLSGGRGYSTGQANIGFTAKF